MPDIMPDITDDPADGIAPEDSGPHFAEYHVTSCIFPCTGTLLLAALGAEHPVEEALAAAELLLLPPRYPTPFAS